MYVAHFSDWHCNEVSADRYMSTVIERVGDEPDLLVVTGDMIDNKMRLVDADPPSEGVRQRWIWEQMVDVYLRYWPGTPILAVRGNHDFCDYGIPGRVIAFDAKEGGSCVVGGVKIAGFRGILEYPNTPWSDQYTEHQIGMLCDLVPADTEILLTHTPPYGVLDSVPTIGIDHGTKKYVRRLGSKSLTGLVKHRLPKLRAHCFGHVHEKGSQSFLDPWNVRYSNAALGVNVFELTQEK